MRGPTIQKNLLGSPDYNIWEDDSPAARALRENLPWHLSAEEKARQPVPKPLPLPEVPAAPSHPGTDSTINDIGNMVEDAAQNSFYLHQEKKRIDDFFNNRTTSSVTLAPSGTPDPASWQKNVQQQVAKTDDLLKQTRTAHPAAHTPASTYPYNDMGKLVKPLSDRAINNLVEPAVKTIKTAVTNKVPVSAAENDLVNLTGAFKNSVIEAAKKKRPQTSSPIKT